jgi:asparagine synthase (glutamine-hydrolysing)
MYYRQAHNLPCDMLIKVDRMAMAASLEVRAPMLDVAVADVASRLPDRQLLRGRTGKHVLRRIARRLVPERVITTPKSGFSIPLHRYQNAAYEEMARDLLLSSDRIAPLFHRQTLEAVIDAGVHTQHDTAGVSVYKATHQLWALVMLAAWATRFDISL